MNSVLPRYEITGETHERSPKGYWMKTSEVLAILEAILTTHWASDAHTIARNAIGKEKRP